MTNNIIQDINTNDNKKFYRLNKDNYKIIILVLLILNIIFAAINVNNILHNEARKFIIQIPRIKETQK
jgi:uncharacterized integral membrane protein